jgi:hypothetical protein
MKAYDVGIVTLPCLVACVFCAGGAEGAIYKCTGTDGRVTYQDSPCQLGSSEKSIKAPPPPATTVSHPSVYVAPVPRSMYESAASPTIPKSIDAKGALETWDRFGKAFNRGDKGAAMQELTPSAQQKYGPVFDALMPPAGAASAKK